MKQATRHAYVFPDPVALIAVADGAGGANIITLAWVGMACSDPVCVTIAMRPSRHSHALLKAAGEFTLNIPSEEMVEATDICGTTSGRDTNKWEAAGLTPEPAEHVSAPRIAECSYSLECRVLQSIELGAHELFIAEVLGAYADDSILTDRGGVDYGLMRPMAYLPDRYHRTGEAVFRYGESKTI